ncbi:hypothetical protein I6N90_12325 [Paenibacillus sp. GSMTC-2017]|nr:hypothetical protein [Paenibacillus sp. GSMTC-2017]
MGPYLHVKWFVRDTDWTPQGFSTVVTPTFLFWFAFTLVIILLASIFDTAFMRIPFVERLHCFLKKLEPYQFIVLRVGLGLALLLQLITGTYLAPDLVTQHWGVYVLLIIAIIGLYHKRTLVISGAALLTLFMIASITYGLFHSLDYIFYLGVIYYLFVAATRFHHTALAVLYSFTGLSLAWLAMEKLTLAKLACSLMHEYSITPMGFTVEEFVLISAFIELGLAWAFIVGLLNRFTALLLTGLFLTTTVLFGWTEIIGHLVVHTLLIIFLVGGRDKHPFLHKLKRFPILRHSLLLLLFCVLLFGLMFIYIWMGQPTSGLSVGLSL